MTELLKIRHPVMMGGMMGANSAEFAAAASNAGGLGTICAVLYKDLEEFREELRKLKSLTNAPFAVNVSIVPEHRETGLAEQYFRIITEEGVPVVETAGRNPEAYMPMLKDHGVTVLHKVVALKHALTAQRIGVDGVIVMGHETAGHPGMDNVSLSVLTQRIAKALDIPVIAAGGSVDGRGLVAALAWGAAGIEMGTRFLAAQECPVHPAIKERVVASSEKDTVLVQKSIQNALRVIKNQYAEQVLALEDRGAGLDELLPLINGKHYREYLKRGEVEKGLLAIGQTVGLVEGLKTTREIIEETVSEAESIIRKLYAICPEQ